MPAMIWALNFHFLLIFSQFCHQFLCSINRFLFMQYKQIPLLLYAFTTVSCWHARMLWIIALLSCTPPLCEVLVSLWMVLFRFMCISQVETVPLFGLGLLKAITVFLQRCWSISVPWAMERIVSANSQELLLVCSLQNFTFVSPLSGPLTERAKFFHRKIPDFISTSVPPTSSSAGTQATCVVSD